MRFVWSAEHCIASHDEKSTAPPVLAAAAFLPSLQTFICERAKEDEEEEGEGQCSNCENKAARERRTTHSTHARVVVGVGGRSSRTRGRGGLRGRSGAGRSGGGSGRPARAGHQRRLAQDEDDSEKGTHLTAEVTMGLVDDEGAAGLDEAGGADVATGFEVEPAAEVVTGAFEVVVGAFEAEVEGAGARDAPPWQ